MHLSCDCLNVLITTKKSAFCSIDSNLTEFFTSDPFFEQDIGLLSVCSINIQVQSLVKVSETGQWKITKCINCENSCYGICTPLGVGSIVARKDLQVDTNRINMLKQHELYSPIFKILIYPTDVSEEETGSDVDVDESKPSLCPVALAWLNEQTALTEERIKAFCDREYAALDELRKRAYRDQTAIIRREQAFVKQVNKETTVIGLNQPFKKSSISDKNKSLESSLSVDDSSFDTEGVFLLDGFEAESCEHANDSDSDESQDSASYQPRKVGVAQIAKSLPIPVPQFMEVDTKRNDDGSPQAPSDIAASMKALAKSIHGDSIFGELPPPRFSTNL